uniref:Innexin n=1 Tax=Steinernema glaseri TaxID=37863 RepID=A0A1I8AQ53_9BILA
MIGESYLTVIYITTKILFLLINSIQFAFMAAFVGGGDRMWGWHVTMATLRGETWRETGLFPRVTMCDFKVNKDNKTINSYTVQCVLSANMLNEKLFVFLWWWAMVLQVTTFSNLIYWLVVLQKEDSRKEFIRDLLVSSGKIDKCRKNLQEGQSEKEKKKETPDKVDSFVRDYIKRDGVLVLRLMVSNAGEIVTSEIVGRLYDCYIEWESQKKQRKQQELEEVKKIPQ